MRIILGSNDNVRSKKSGVGNRRTWHNIPRFHQGIMQVSWFSSPTCKCKWILKIFLQSLCLKLTCLTLIVLQKRNV